MRSTSRVQRRPVGPQSDNAAAVEAPREHLAMNGGLALPELEARSFLEPLAGVHERLPQLAVRTGIESAHEQALGPPAARQATAKQPRRKHFRVVDDEQISGIEERREIAECAIGADAGVSVEGEKPRIAALGWRRLRDQLVGEKEVEVRKEQAVSLRPSVRLTA